MRRSIPLALAAALALTSVPGRERTLAEIPSAVTSITARDLESRLSVLPGRNFDEILLDVGKKYVSSSSATPLVRGWSCEPRGGSWRCAGPAVPEGHFTLRAEPGVTPPAKYGLDVLVEGQRVSRQEISLTEIERVEVIRDTTGALYGPSGVRAGELFMITPKAGRVGGGEWGLQVGDRRIPALDEATLESRFSLGGPLVRDRVFFVMPESVRSASELRFTFDDPWGERWLDAPAPDFLFGGPPAPACEPLLADCQSLVVVGETLCVCGCFPPTALGGLMLDGKPIGAPLGASTRMMRFALPEELQPGRHVVAWPAAGQAIQFEAVRVRGSVDQEKLLVGQSTRLEFGLDGTEQVLPMEIELERGNVLIAGGNKQLAFTSGGPSNEFSRTLFAAGVGPFDIQYRFSSAACPCAGDNAPRLIDDSQALHPMSLAGRLDGTFTSGAQGTFPLTLAADSIVARTPFPPLAVGQPLEIEFLQLGLEGSTPGFEKLRFEERADQRSVGRFRDTRLDAEGRFTSGVADLELFTEFSTAYHKKLPLQVGGTYELGLSNFELGGSIPGLGRVGLSERDDARSTVRFEEIRKDAAGKTLFGSATFRLYTDLRVEFQETR